jgi:glycosidase
MLYYGDEVGMLGENDPDCRRCMIWDEAGWNREVNSAVRTLIALRRDHPALRRGSWEPLLAFNGVLAYRRRLDGDDLVVVLNPRDAQRDFEIPLDAEPGCWRDLLGGGDYPLCEGALRFSRLGERSALILAPR